MSLPDLPEPTIVGTAYHPELKICYNSVVHYTAEQMLEYGRKCQEALQAKLDALMLEYCPDEMTTEQLKEWAAHQKAYQGAVPIFEKEYGGFESVSDLERDVSEALDSSYNPQAKHVPAEFQGTLTVKISYKPEESSDD